MNSHSRSENLKLKNSNIFFSNFPTVMHQSIMSFLSIADIVKLGKMNKELKLESSCYTRKFIESVSKLSDETLNQIINEICQLNQNSNAEIYITELRARNRLNKEIQVVNTEDQAKLPLHIATNNGHHHVVKLLMKWKADVNASQHQDPVPYCFALGKAISNLNVECVKALLTSEDIFKSLTIVTRAIEKSYQNENNQETKVTPSELCERSQRRLAIIKLILMKEQTKIRFYDLFDPIIENQDWLVINGLLTNPIMTKDSFDILLDNIIKLDPKVLDNDALAIFFKEYSTKHGSFNESHLRSALENNKFNLAQMFIENGANPLLETQTAKKMDDDFPGPVLIHIPLLEYLIMYNENRKWDQGIELIKPYYDFQNLLEKLIDKLVQLPDKTLGFFKWNVTKEAVFRDELVKQSKLILNDYLQSPSQIKDAKLKLMIAINDYKNNLIQSHNDSYIKQISQFLDIPKSQLIYPLTIESIERLICLHGKQEGASVPRGRKLK